MSGNATAVSATAVRKAAEFYTIELAHLVDGTMSISMTATTVDEEEPQLLNQEIASERVATIDEALAIIKTGLIGANNSP
jgi:hypothetical protein